LVELERVRAFEPQPECQRRLKNIVNRIPNSQVHEAAVGDHTGDIEFICTNNSKLSSILPPASGISENYDSADFSIKSKQVVSITRLDDIIPPEQEVGLMKIDVQGYELSVLKGAHRTLNNTIAVLLEVNFMNHYIGGATFDEVYQFLRRSGFRLAGVSPAYYGASGPLWADAIFLNERLNV
jgi:FkbM family methyltransferase